jgi:hypothetical protein
MIILAGEERRKLPEFTSRFNSAQNHHIRLATSVATEDVGLGLHQESFI